MISRFQTPFVSVLFAMLCAVLLLGAPAAQATDSVANPRQQMNTLYQQLLVTPADVDLTLAYAKAATAAGDYEAAIPPLERLLLSNPQSPKLRLELGILYSLLGSKDVARTYLQEAKTSGANQPEIVSQADRYLSRM